LEKGGEMKKTVTLDKPDRLASLKIVDQSAENYSVLRFKVSQINILLQNLEFHIREISESRGDQDDEQIKNLYEALDRVRIENLRFNYLIEQLPEVKDGSH
jgi:hypothetical protein